VSDERVRRRALVTGRVQGVFFRDGVRREAVARGVAGQASNLDDGSVEVVLEGSPEDVDAVLAQLGRASRPARIDTVEQLTPGPVEGLRGFTVS
jgi:acylphosphatase